MLSTITIIMVDPSFEGRGYWSVVTPLRGEERGGEGKLGEGRGGY